MGIPSPCELPMVQLALCQTEASNDWRDLPGVYCLYDDQTPLYIGESGNVYRRLAEHIEMVYHVMSGGFLWWRETIPPLYFHAADAFKRNDLKTRLLAGEIEDKAERLALEKAFCIQLGQDGIYNRSSRLIKPWKVIDTCSWAIEGERRKAEHLEARKKKKEAK